MRRFRNRSEESREDGSQLDFSYLRSLFAFFFLRRPLLLRGILALPGMGSAPIRIKIARVAFCNVQLLLDQAKHRDGRFVQQMPRLIGEIQGPMYRGVPFRLRLQYPVSDVWQIQDDVPEERGVFQNARQRCNKYSK